jgi:hypothetical protein
VSASKPPPTFPADVYLVHLDTAQLDEIERDPRTVALAFVNRRRRAAKRPALKACEVWPILSR